MATATTAAHGDLMGESKQPEHDLLHNKEVITGLFAQVFLIKWPLSVCGTKRETCDVFELKLCNFIQWVFVSVWSANARTLRQRVFNVGDVYSVRSVEC